jgi:predicted Rossmann fold nucleotide-binding protein DprA/Smf involved in DNA uptake
MQRDHRNLLRDERLVLVSPFDPSAGFNAGNAMSRNKLIYAFADAALVVNADLKKGGTWAGAVEQLDKFRFVPVYLRSTGTQPSAFDALRLKGAMPWHNPDDAESFEAIFNNTVETQVHAAAPDLFTQVCSATEHTTRSGTGPDSVPMGAGNKSATDVDARPEIDKPAQTDFEHISEDGTSVMPANRAFVSGSSPSAEQKMPPEEILFQGVRESLFQLLSEPMKSEDIAKALNIAKGQTNIWLKRLVEDGTLEKYTQPVRYGIRQTSLL